MNVLLHDLANPFHKVEIMASVLSSLHAQIGTVFAPQKEVLSDAQKRVLLDEAKASKRTIDDRLAACKLVLSTETDQKALKGMLESIKKDFKDAFDAVLEGIPPGQIAEAKKVIQPVVSEVEQEITELSAQIKLCKKMADLQFPQVLVVTHPDFCTFLFESNLAFWIACFRNSTEAGPQNHGVRLTDEGDPQIKLNGEWKTWAEVQKVVVYDKVQLRLVAAADSKLGYTYLSPMGLVQKDRFDYDQIYPVERLSEREYAELRASARKFYDTNEEVDPGVEKDAIYQVVTTFRTKWWGIEIPENWLTKNLIGNFPRHVTLRVIDKDRNVYSFGFEMKKEESESITSFFPPTVLKSGTTHVSVPDYEEPRPYELRTTTNVPITSVRAKTILDFVSLHNREGVRFNFMKQNCTKLTGETLALAGYRIDTRISFGDFFGNIMPNLKDVPYIGTPLHFVVETVMSVVRPILNAVKAYTPQVIKSVVRFIPELIQTVLINIFLLCLGASTMTSPLPEGVEDERDNTTKLGRFSRIIRSPLDMFRENCDINYSQAIVDWQKMQKSTQEVRYDGTPKFNFI